MNFKKAALLLLFLIGFYTLSFSQIQFKIALINGEDLYEVSLISNQDFTYPGNIIGSAQISIKAPLNGFSLGAVENLQEGIKWDANSFIQSPLEAQEYQYLSFGLTTIGVPFVLKKEEELALFRFTNQEGTCPGEVSLVDNESDAFLPPNSRNINIGNQITPFACTNLRNKNAYEGNVEEGIANCEQTTSLEIIEDQPSLDLFLSPNPAHDWLNIAVHTRDTKAPMLLQIRAMTGQLIWQQRMEAPIANSLQLKKDISSFSSGAYYLQLIQKNKAIKANFVKGIK